MAGTILHPALRLLIRRNLRAKLRRLRSAFRSPKRMAASLFMLVFFAFIVGQSVLVAVVNGPTDPALARSTIPVGLLAMTVLNLILTKPETGIVFLPAEVDFLFPAPFRRSELLVYKIIGAALTSAALGLFFSLFAFRYVPVWFAGFVGITLSLMFLQLIQMAVALLASTVQETAYTRGRRYVLIGVVLVIAVGLAAALATDGANIVTVATHWRDSWIGMAVLAPFEMFGRTITAETIPQFAGWGAAATAIVMLLALIVVRLDANFLEVSAAASEKRYELIQRARRGNPWAAIGGTGSKRRIPQLPRWGGAGPIAWRQMCTALRGSRRLVFLLILFGAGSAVPMFVVSGRGHSATPLLAIAAPILLFYLPMMLQFDFRGDVDRIDVLKSLPIRPLAMVIGQLATPIAIASVLQLTCIAGAAIVERKVSWILIAVVACLLPVNLLVFALENLVFLLFPYRMATGDLQSQGRTMLLVFLKFILLFLLAGIAAGVGGLAYLATESWIAFAAAAWTVATILALSILPLLCWAFRRLDPSTDIPV